MSGDHDQGADAPLVRVERCAGVARLVLCSPANANALSPRLVSELTGHLAEAGSDAGVRVVVLASTGRAFCSGFDLKSVARGERPDAADLPGLLQAVTTLSKPVVAAVDGAVRGGGMGLVAASDLALATPRSSFAFSEVRLGVTPAIISVACARRMSSRSLSRYMLTAEVFGADQACAAGLVTAVVGAQAAAGEAGATPASVTPAPLTPAPAAATPPADGEAASAALEEAVGALCEAFAATEPGAVATTKALLRDLPALSGEVAASYTSLLSRAAFSSAEAAEGIAAFLDKRPPPWAR